MPYGIPCHALMVRHSCATALPRQETFTFSLIRADHVSMLLLQLVVYDKDAGTADDFIAQCASARCMLCARCCCRRESGAAGEAGDRVTGGSFSRALAPKLSHYTFPHHPAPPTSSHRAPRHGASGRYCIALHNIRPGWRKVPLFDHQGARMKFSRAAAADVIRLCPSRRLRRRSPHFWSELALALSLCSFTSDSNEGPGVGVSCPFAGTCLPLCAPVWRAPVLYETW
jgi:hypothetical protein